MGRSSPNAYSPQKVEIMFWSFFIVFLLIMVIGYQMHNQGNIENKPSDSDDLSEEEIEYDYLQRMEQEQEEEDEYWLEQRDK